MALVSGWNCGRESEESLSAATARLQSARTQSVSSACSTREKREDFKGGGLSLVTEMRVRLIDSAGIWQTDLCRRLVEWSNRPGCLRRATVSVACKHTGKRDACRTCASGTLAPQCRCHSKAQFLG